MARFRKKFLSSGLKEELKEKDRYEKPSQKKKKDKYRHQFERKLAKKRSFS